MGCCGSKEADPKPAGSKPVEAKSVPNPKEPEVKRAAEPKSAEEPKPVTKGEEKAQSGAVSNEGPQRTSPLRKVNVLKVKLPEKEPVSTVLETIHQDALDVQMEKLEKLRTEQQERIAMLHKSIKEKQNMKNQKKAKEAEVKQFSKEEKATIKKIFEKFDTDKSGYIDRDEFRAMVERLGVNVPERDIEGALETLSSDGKVNFEDFLKWWGSDSSRGGNKGIALAMARMKLRALGASSKLKDKLDLENARYKAGIGLPIETDATVKMGEMDAPRTQLKVSLSTYTEDEFKAISDTKFKDAEKPIQPADSMIVDSDEDDDAVPILLAELTLELRKCDKEKEMVQCLKHLTDVAVSQCAVEGGWLWAHVLDNDLPNVTIQVALAHVSLDQQVLEQLTGTAHPDKDDLEKFLNQVEMDVNMGADLDTGLRRLLEDATSLVSIADAGLQFKMKGRLAPSVISMLLSFGGEEQSSKERVIMKVMELVVSSCNGTFVELALGNPSRVLEDAVGSFVTKVSQQLPGTGAKNIQEELVKLRGALMFISTVVIEKRLTLSNTPLMNAVEMLREAVDWDEGTGKHGAMMTPVEVLFYFAQYVKEVKSITAWTKYQKVEIDAQGLALFSALPRSDEEVERYLTERRVSRGFTANYSTVQVMKFPGLLGILDGLTEDNILTDGLRSVIEAIADLEDEELCIPTPG